MSGLVIVPCLTVGRAELAEARRALAGQGRAVSDEPLRDALWIARALPAVLDVLGALSLLDVELGAATVEVTGVPRPRVPLSLVAWRRDHEAAVEVIVLHDHDLELRAFDAAVVRVRVPLRLRLSVVDASQPDQANGEPVVRLQRFSFGAAGKSPS